jgi:hypothetical protein
MFTRVRVTNKVGNRGHTASLFLEIKKNGYTDVQLYIVHRRKINTSVQIIK